MKKIISVFILACICLLSFASCDPGSNVLDIDYLLENTTKVELVFYNNEEPEILNLNKTEKPKFDFNKATLIETLDIAYTEDIVNELVGGDLTVLDEADDIINLCLDRGVSRMSFHSSCIYYSKGIERALKELNTMNFDFSIDCGNRELYKKIKRIDAFEQVITNIKKYLSISKSAKRFRIINSILIFS